MPFTANYKCSDCGHRFERVTETDPRKKGGRPPSCPECRKGKYSSIKSIDKSNKVYTQKELDKNERDIAESKRMPSLGGQSNFNKALDIAANICMQDGNLTDINIGSNLRAGDSCAPKLSHELERKVDEVFKPQANKVMGMQGANNLNRALTGQINAGKYASQSGSADIAARAKNSGYKVPTTIIHEHNSERKPN